MPKIKLDRHNVEQKSDLEPGGKFFVDTTATMWNFCNCNLAKLQITGGQNIFGMAGQENSKLSSV